MKVRKRNGVLVPADFTQVRKQTLPACEGLGNVSYERLEINAQILMYDEMPTSEITEILIKTAMNFMDVDQPQWSYVASRLSLYDHYHKIKHLHGKKTSGNVYEQITLSKHLDKYKDIYSDFYKKYTKEEIEELNRVIEPDRDLMYDYIAMTTMLDRYIAKLNDKETNIELPQHMHMLVAMFLAQNEKDKVKWAKKFYNRFSLLKWINATPVNANGRLKNGSTISCLVGTVPDSIEGIYTMLGEVAKGSQLGSGWGLDWTNIRSKGSWIGNIKGIAGGKIPFLKVYGDTSIAVDQRGVRPGAFAVYCSDWDIDVFDFIDLKKKSGTESRRSQELYIGISISNLFIKRDKEDGDWTLFDPYDVRDLVNLHGEAYEKRYVEYEQEFKEHPERFNPFTQTIKAKDLMRTLTLSYNNEGQPFLLFKDNANATHKYEKEFGIVRTTNLCTEIMQATDDDHTAVCNLGSINMARIESMEDLKETIIVGMRAMDNSIDLTEYPSEKAKKTQLERRSTGMGMLGEAQYLAEHSIEFGSKEHEEVIHKFYGYMEEISEWYTRELAKEKGSCIIPGKRNAYIRAVAPNSTSGLFASTSNSHEPVYEKIWLDESKIGLIKVTAPNINANTFFYYKSAYEVDQFRALEMTALRQKYIDQGISHNLYLDPKGLKASTIRKLIWHASDLGIKSLYYLRSKPPKNTGKEISKKDEKIACIGCAN